MDFLSTFSPQKNSKNFRTIGESLRDLDLTHNNKSNIGNVQHIGVLNFKNSADLHAVLKIYILQYSSTNVHISNACKTFLKF